MSNAGRRKHGWMARGGFLEVGMVLGTYSANGGVMDTSLNSNVSSRVVSIKEMGDLVKGGI